MYLHIGHDLLVAEREIIGLFNRDLLNTSPGFRHLYNRLRMDGRVVGSIDDAKTVVVTNHDVMYLSTISSHTLMRRSERQMFIIE